MTTDQQLTSITPIINDLLEVKGCPKLPEWVDLEDMYILGDEATDGGYEGGTRNPPAVLNEVCMWTMGKVVPWVQILIDDISITLPYADHVIGGETRFRCRVILDIHNWDSVHAPIVVDESSFILAILALLRAIHGVVCGKGGEDERASNG